MKLKKTIIGIVLWIISLGIVFAIGKVHSRVHTITKEISVSYSVPVYIKDTNGITHAQFRSVRLERDQYKHQLDSISSLLHIKSKDISTINDAVEGVHIKEGGDTVIVHDTVYSFYKNNPYVSLYGKVSPHNWNLDLSLTDTLHTVVYNKSTLFSPIQTYIDISNSNPYVDIKSGRSVSIIQKRPFFTIGPYLGYELYPNPHFSVGISIQHPMIFLK